MKNNLRKNFTIVDNSILNSKELSLKAKGLYAYMLSKPENWNFSYAGMKFELKEGEKSLRSAVKELENINILVKIPLKQNNYFIGWEWILHPTDEELRIAKHDQNGHDQNGHDQNGHDIINTIKQKKINNKDNKEIEEKEDEPQLRISTTTDFHNYGKPYDINNTDNTINRDINNTDIREEEKEEGYVLKSTKGMYSKVQRVCTQKYNNSNINNRDINIKKENKKKSKFQTLLDQLPKQLLTEKAKEYLEDFYKYRTEIKKPIKTYRPLLAYLNTLIALKNKNINLEEAIKVMKDREWQTLKEDWLKNTGLESWSA